MPIQNPSKPKKIQCPECDGSGQKPVGAPTAKFTNEPCPDCGGTGLVEAIIVIQ